MKGKSYLFLFLAILLAHDNKLVFTILEVMEISWSKSKSHIDSIKPRPSTKIWMNGKTLEEVDQFKYFGPTQMKDGTSTKEVKIRLAPAQSAMAKLAILWKNKDASFPANIKLLKSLVLSIRLYGCESWTPTANLDRRIQAFENKRISILSETRLVFKILFRPRHFFN